jgi:hypothetical protein
MDQWIAWVDLDSFCRLHREAFGYVASALVLTTFSMSSMRRLRLTAIASNVAFLLYAWATHLFPILVLHGILLPLNIVRLAQLELTRTIAETADPNLTRPFGAADRPSAR